MPIGEGGKREGGSIKCTHVDEVSVSIVHATLVSNSIPPLGGQSKKIPHQIPLDHMG